MTEAPQRLSRRRNRRILMLAAAGFLLAVAFALGVLLTLAVWGLSARHVQVEVLNRSGVACKAQLSYRSSGANGEVDLGLIPPDQARMARFFVSGEGSYAIVATCPPEPTGHVQTAAESYVEPGYRLRSVITPSGIAPGEMR
jgi:hypothetical protein